MILCGTHAGGSQRPFTIRDLPAATRAALEASAAAEGQPVHDFVRDRMIDLAAQRSKT